LKIVSDEFENTSFCIISNHLITSKQAFQNLLEIFSTFTVKLVETKVECFSHPATMKLLFQVVKRFYPLSSLFSKNIFQQLTICYCFGQLISLFPDNLDEFLENEESLKNFVRLYKQLPFQVQFALLSLFQTSKLKLDSLCVKNDNMFHLLFFHNFSIPKSLLPKFSQVSYVKSVLSGDYLTFYNNPLNLKLFSLLPLSLEVNSSLFNLETLLSLCFNFEDLSYASLLKFNFLHFSTFFCSISSIIYHLFKHYSPHIGLFKPVLLFIELFLCSPFSIDTLPKTVFSDQILDHLHKIEEIVFSTPSTWLNFLIKKQVSFGSDWILSIIFGKFSGKNFCEFFQNNFEKLITYPLSICTSLNPLVKQEIVLFYINIVESFHNIFPNLLISYIYSILDFLIECIYYSFSSENLNNCCFFIQILQSLFKSPLYQIVYCQHSQLYLPIHSMISKTTPITILFLIFQIYQSFLIRRNVNIYLIVSAMMPPYPVLYSFRSRIQYLIENNYLESISELVDDILKLIEVNHLTKDLLVIKSSKDKCYHFLSKVNNFINSLFKTSKDKCICFFSQFKTIPIEMKKIEFFELLKQECEKMYSNHEKISK
jgi:hypothetical protein